MPSSLMLPNNVAVRSEAEKIAELVLEMHWDEDTLPVDPVVVARRLGAEVYTAQLGNEVIGMVVGKPDGASIYLDYEQPPNRYRFTCAHELGHYVDRSGDLERSINYVDRRTNEASMAPDEIYANHFAGALLMPRKKVQEFENQGLSDFAMAAEFGVSLAAMRYRRTLLSRAMPAA